MLLWIILGPDRRSSVGGSLLGGRGSSSEGLVSTLGSGVVLAPFVHLHVLVGLLFGTIEQFWPTWDHGGAAWSSDRGGAQTNVVEIF